LRAWRLRRAPLPAVDAHRGRAGAARHAAKDIVMSKIGSFKLVSGEYQGEIITLSVQAKSVRITPEENSSGNAPSHRVFVGDAEVGAAWAKTSQDKRPYLSVKLDDPSFVAPIFAQLFAGEEREFDLVWSRQPRRADN
jgi:uncharacterized protein (DUF736 family)